MTDHSLHRVHSLSLGEISSAALRLASHWLRRRRLNRLQELDDHMLDDIGLRREDIDASLQQPLSIDPVWDINHRARLRHVRGSRHR